jgi:hypothetical protein
VEVVPNCSQLRYRQADNTAGLKSESLISSMPESWSNHYWNADRDGFGNRDRPARESAALPVRKIDFQSLPVRWGAS